MLRRSFTAEVDDPSHPGVNYAAGTAMLVAASKIRDNLIDDPGWLRGFRTIASSAAARCRRAAGDCLAGLGFDASLIEEQFTRQAEVEALNGQDFTFYSRPTELAAGAVFAHTAVLQQKPQNYRPLFEIGRRFGRIMLLLDAYDDYERDAQAGHFNALAASYRGEAWRQPAQSLFLQIHSQLREVLLSLDLSKPDLLHSLLVHQLGKIGKQSLGLCRSLRSAHLAESRAARPLAAPGYPSIYPVRGYYPDDEDASPGKDPFPEDNRLCSCANCCNRRRYPNSGDNLPDCCYSCYWIDCSYCDCGDCDCGDCDCGDCDCADCDCSDCDCGDCDCGDCSGCDCDCG